MVYRMAHAGYSARSIFLTNLWPPGYCYWEWSRSDRDRCVLCASHSLYSTFHIPHGSQQDTPWISFRPSAQECCNNRKRTALYIYISTALRVGISWYNIKAVLTDGEKNFDLHAAIGIFMHALDAHRGSHMHAFLIPCGRGVYLLNKSFTLKWKITSKQQTGMVHTDWIRHSIHYS